MAKHSIERTPSRLNPLRYLAFPGASNAKLAFARSPRLILMAIAVVVGIMLVNSIDPYSGATASPYYQPVFATAPGSQSVALGGDYTNSATRDGVKISAGKAASASAPAAGEPDPDSAQAIALGIVKGYGWGLDQYDCLVSLWNRESHWNVYSENLSSGAYGIPQALPGDKMASAGDDWRTNPATQIIWGLGYIEGRYGSPCGAWAHSEDTGWY